MASLKTNTPFIMYFNGFNYSEWGQMGFTFDKKFTTYMKDHKIDGIIFDYMYHVSVYQIYKITLLILNQLVLILITIIIIFLLIFIVHI